MLPNALQPSATDHIPVLAEEVRDLLQVERGDTVVDATFGAGGHAELLAADLHGKGKLIADCTMNEFIAQSSGACSSLRAMCHPAADWVRSLRRPPLPLDHPPQKMWQTHPLSNPLRTHFTLAGSRVRPLPSAQNVSRRLPTLA